MNRARALITSSASLLLATGWLAAGLPAQSRPASRLVLNGTTSAEGWGGGIGGLAISPDGKRVAYVAGDGPGAVYPDNRRNPQYIWLRGVNDSTAVRLSIPDLPDGIFALTFSPDGQSLAFSSPQQLRRVSVTGGESALICPGSAQYGLSWGADDRIVFSTGQRIWRVSASGGPPDLLVVLRERRIAENPEVLPDSGAVLFTDRGLNFALYPDDRPQLVAQPLPAGARTVIADPARNGHYVAGTGQLVYEFEGRLFVVAFDPKQLRSAPGGGGIVATIDDAVDGWGSYAVAAEGTLVYQTGRHGWRSAALVAWDGTRTAIGRLPGTAATPRVSPDGRRVAFEAKGIWVADISDVAAARRLTSGAFDRAPVWSPDGVRIAYTATGHDRVSSIYARRADGTGEAELLIHRADVQESWSSSAGPSFLRIVGQSISLWTYAPSTRTSKLIRYLQSSRSSSAFSPDGRWLAFETDEYDPASRMGPRVDVQSFPTAGARIKVPGSVSRHPVWSRDGRELFFEDANGKLFTVDFHEGSSGRLATFGEPRELPITGFNRGGFYSPRSYDVMPDGRAFFMIFSAPIELAVIPDWAAQVRVPHP